MTTPARRIVAENRRLIWTIALALVANVLLYVLVVYPLAQKEAGGELAAEASSRALAAARRDHAAARATVSGKDQADAELQKFYGDVLPPDVGGARRMTYLFLEQLARKTGLRLRDRQSGAADVRDSSLAKFTTTVALAGEYQDIRRFIHELETAPEFLVLENVELSQAEAESGRGIDVRVAIATYFRAGGHGTD